MTTSKKIELSISETRIGNYGAIDSSLNLITDLSDGKGTSLNRRIERFESEEEYSSKKVSELTIASSLGDNRETVVFYLCNITPIGSEDYLNIIISLDKRDGGKCVFTGTFGSIDILDFVPVDIYSKLKSTFVEMSNPNNKFDLNVFVNALRTSGNAVLVEWVYHWNRLIEPIDKLEQTNLL